MPAPRGEGDEAIWSACSGQHASGPGDHLADTEGDSGSTPACGASWYASRTAMCLVGSGGGTLPMPGWVRGAWWAGGRLQGNDHR